ncbi:hypothetical protein [Microbacterium sp. SD291]|uniref:hypothetical protein n=1 Tax=Microbacterium sp. SD291 TaxID=2782007 RepID=UPI001A9735EA|nr:hypothetical protein [Microbacterium sp. SD291]MBO0980087.1 hypothetical protein [Microbacterium sp. SD291]
MTTTSVHRLGGEIRLDERISWRAPGAEGTQQVSCYLIVGAAGAVLVDTGIRLHENVILERLGSLLPAGTPLSVLLTRTEMESCLNLPIIEERFGVEAVWYTGGITVPRSTAEVRRVSVEPGTSLWIEPYPTLRLELISPMLRLLPTLWVHEPHSGALLTSDGFTHGDRPVESGLHKFQWFRRAETSAIAAHVRQVVAERSIRFIAPGYGEPFTGEDRVRAEAEALAVTLERIGLS